MLMGVRDTSRQIGCGGGGTIGKFMKQKKTPNQFCWLEKEVNW